MTNEEKQEIISSVIQSLQTNSATIDQLNEVESCSEGDFIELNKGRKISAENLAKDVNILCSMVINTDKGYLFLEFFC